MSPAKSGANAASTSKTKPGAKKQEIFEEPDIKTEPEEPTSAPPTTGQGQWTRARILKHLTFVVTVILFTIAVLMILRYVITLKNMKHPKTAMDIIRETMINRNTYFENRDDEVVLDGAQELTENIPKMKSKIEEVSNVLADARWRRSQGWVPFQGSLYIVIEKKLLFEEAKTSCENKQSYLTDIMSEEEANFLKDKAPIVILWIGLVKRAGKWVWLDGRGVGNEYWREGYPQSDPCGVIAHCTKGGNCMENKRCSDKYWSVCKFQSNQQYFP